MHIFIIFMILFLLLLVIMAIVLGITKSSRSTNVLATSIPSLQAAYDASSFTDGPNINSPTKPFRITNLTPNTPAVFDINLATGGYARFPPGYVRGLTLSVIENGANVLIDAGFAVSEFTESNIIVHLGLTIATSNGANGLDTGILESGKWYYVYVIASSFGIVQPAGLLSLSGSAPAVMPTGFDIYRRLGSVLAQFLGDEPPAFLPMRQEGEGTSRITLYTGNVLNNLFYTTPGLYEFYIPVPVVNLGDPTISLIPPQATHLIMNVATEPGGLNSNLSLRFRKRFSTEPGPWIIGISNNQPNMTQITIRVEATPLPQELEYGVFVNNGGVTSPGFFARFYAIGYYESV